MVNELLLVVRLGILLTYSLLLVCEYKVTTFNFDFPSFSEFYRVFPSFLAQNAHF